MLYITGDIHGNPSRMQGFVTKHPLTKDDFYLVAGDFGLPWDPTLPPWEETRLDWFAQQEFTTLFIDGNHENFPMLNSYPVVNFMGGKAHKLNDKLYHLRRGEIYTIAGKRIFCFGGAASLDKLQRIAGISWWPEELYNHAEIEHALDNLEKCHYNVDYVITHAAPKKFLLEKFSKFNLATFHCPVQDVLDELETRINYTYWFFGHYHMDYIDKKLGCFWLYEDTIELKEGKAKKGSLS